MVQSDLTESFTSTWKSSLTYQTLVLNTIWSSCRTWRLTYILMQMYMATFYFCSIIFTARRHSAG